MSVNQLTVIETLLCVKHCSKGTPQVNYLPVPRPYPGPCSYDPYFTCEELRHSGCTYRSCSSEAFQLAVAERRFKCRPVAAQPMRVTGEEP